MHTAPGALLKQIDSPADLKNLSREQLQQLSEELRQYIIDVVSVHGGHFGASLGVVELTVALHYIYNTLMTSLYGMLATRLMDTKYSPGEEILSQATANTRVSAASQKEAKANTTLLAWDTHLLLFQLLLGMAMAAKYKGENRKTVAVIGDGAMTAGQAFEAMNHAGVADTDMLIILNDNCMSIDPNVGALKEYLTDITTSPTYNKVKDDVWKALG